MGWSGVPTRSPQPGAYARRVRASTAAIVDTVLVFVFVAIGRNNHHKGVAAAGIVRTTAPFLIALAVGWLGARAWTRPTQPTTGLIVWIATVALGLLLRRVMFHGGTAAAFVIVAALFNLATLVGWRVMSSWFAGRVANGAASPRD